MAVVPNQGFISTMLHPFKFRLFALMKLPSAFFSGVRVRTLDQNTCTVSVPYKWFSQNPFRSTYFACLAMAAEMSTGVLALMYLHKLEPAVSMLVVKLEAEYFKKATDKTTFICKQGEEFCHIIERALVTGESQQMVAISEGFNETGDLIARFHITWSFKARSRKASS